MMAQAQVAGIMPPMPMPIQQMGPPMMAGPPRPLVPQISARPPLPRPAFQPAPPQPAFQTAAPIPQPVVQPVAPVIKPETDDQPRFVFRPKNPEKPVEPVKTEKPAMPFFAESTPARQNGHKFVFKSPEQADQENAKLEEDEKREEANEGDQGKRLQI